MNSSSEEVKKITNSNYSFFPSFVFRFISCISTACSSSWTSSSVCCMIIHILKPSKTLHPVWKSSLMIYFRYRYPALPAQSPKEWPPIMYSHSVVRVVSEQCASYDKWSVTRYINHLPSPYHYHTIILLSPCNYFINHHQESVNLIYESMCLQFGGKRCVLYKNSFVRARLIAKISVLFLVP